MPSDIRHDNTCTGTVLPSLYDPRNSDACCVQPPPLHVCVYVCVGTHEIMRYEQFAPAECHLRSIPDGLDSPKSPEISECCKETNTCSDARMNMRPDLQIVFVLCCSQLPPESPNPPPHVLVLVITRSSRGHVALFSGAVHAGPPNQQLYIL